MSATRGQRRPGPKGASFPIDASRYSLGMPSLSLSMPQVDPALDRWRIQEALRRGGTAVEILFLFAREKQAKAESRPQATGPLSRFSLDPELKFNSAELEYDRFLASTILDAEMEYRAEMQEEFDSLSEGVQRAFGFKGDTPFNHYLRIRPAYYNAGYDDPAGTIFTQMQESTLAGKKIVSPGVHKRLAELLPKAEALLNSWRPGLAGEIGQQLNSIGGFVPRYIAPKRGEKRKPVLSNHALGLALDIDPSTNPHIKEAAVIAILNEIAKDTGIDYGKLIVERPTDGATPEWAAQIHAKAQKASDLVQAWLSKYLPAYLEVEERLAMEKKIAQAKKPAEKEKLLQQLSDSGPAPMQSPALSADKSAAVEKIRTLVKYHGLPAVKAWAKGGIQTIPLFLAVALVKAGLRWGQAYISSKDAMHFELVEAKTGRSVIRPESKARSLEDLFLSPVRNEMRTKPKKKAAKAAAR